MCASQSCTSGHLKLPFPASRRVQGNSHPAAETEDLHGEPQLREDSERKKLIVFDYYPPDWMAIHNDKDDADDAAVGSVNYNGGVRSDG